MAEAFSIKFDGRGATAGLDRLTTDVAAVTRPVAQAGAQVFYDEMKLRVPVKTGLLKESIYQVYSVDNSDAKKSTYHVTWNRKKAPHGHLVEYGTSRAPAHPFQRPAFDSAAPRALKASEAKLEEQLKKALP